MNSNINKKKKDIIKSLDFLEELIWLLDSNKTTKLKEIPQIVRELINNTSEDDLNVATEYRSQNPNIHFLIGVLPRLFMDEVLFPTNQSIIQFAEEVLQIDISNQGKRSKYEYIGLIVCETNKLSDNKLHNLVTALSKITSNESNLIKIKENRNKNNFSWNETIQELTERRNDKRDL